MTAETPSPDEKDLAKQLRTYADATTAFAVVQGVAVAIALGSKDFRDNVLKTPWWVIPLMCLCALVVYGGIVFVCNLGENKLAGTSTAKVLTWTRVVQVGRFAAIVFAVSIVLVGIYFTRRGACPSQKPPCEEKARVERTILQSAAFDLQRMEMRPKPHLTSL